MNLPSRLKRGDRVGVVSPSAPIDTDELLSRLNSGIRVLNDMGFDVVTAKNALRVRGYSAGTPLEKANDINTMFGDESISAIICSQGGGTANGCLPLLDWKADSCALNCKRAQYILHDGRVHCIHSERIAGSIGHVAAEHRYWERTPVRVV